MPYRLLDKKAPFRNSVLSWDWFARTSLIRAQVQMLGTCPHDPQIVIVALEARSAPRQSADEGGTHLQAVWPWAPLSQAYLI